MSKKKPERRTIELSEQAKLAVMAMDPEAKAEFLRALEWLATAEDPTKPSEGYNPVKVGEDHTLVVKKGEPNA